MRPFSTSTFSCGQMNASMLFWMTSTSRPRRRGPSPPCGQRKRLCPNTPTSKSTSGKTRAWNAAGEEPPGLVAALSHREGDPPCWTGSWALPPQEQGLVVLGAPIGSREYVARILQEKRGQQDLLLARLPAVQDLQSAWLLLLLCAAPRCNYLLRTVPRSATASYAASHDEAILRCLATLLPPGHSWPLSPPLALALAP